MMTVLDIQHLKKYYRSPNGGGQHLILDIDEFSLKKKEQIVLKGMSGSGKTTFLHLISGVLKTEHGRIVLAGTDVSEMPEGKRDRYRARHIGYIFQTFNLLQGYTALENIVMAMMFAGGPDYPKARRLLERVGLKDRMSYFPRQLSVGQQQRVAVARALANQPSLVLADEPTGNLDPHHARETIRLIKEICQEFGSALLVVTHSLETMTNFEKVEDFHRLNKTLKDKS